MESPTSDIALRGDSDASSGDLERNAPAEANSRRRRLLSFDGLPVSLMKRGKRWFWPNILKITTFVATVLCVLQLFWIQHLQAGWERIPNDSFDNTFYDVSDRNSPLLWDSKRQNFISSAMPVPVHSHNDYTRRIPLFEALGSGCISVEADVHLRDSNLLVGHTTIGLKEDSTLRSMYLEPLQRMLDARNGRVSDGSWRGIFDSAPQQTIVLLVDIKTSGAETFALLDAQLQPLRDLDYLTYWNGTGKVIRPLTIVATGNAPFASVLALNETHRDVFLDAPLHKLLLADDDLAANPPVYGYNESNSHFASAQFKDGRLFSPYNDTTLATMSPSARDAALTQIEQAKARGLIARYWDTPADPPNTRDIAWRVLVSLRVGIVNMDDLGTVRARASGWGKIDQLVETQL